MEKFQQFSTKAKKIIFSFLMPLIFAPALYSNGLPLEVLQENPYFRNGAPDYKQDDKKNDGSIRQDTTETDTKKEFQFPVVDNENIQDDPDYRGYDFSIPENPKATRKNDATTKKSKAASKKSRKASTNSDADSITDSDTDFSEPLEDLYEDSEESEDYEESEDSEEEYIDPDSIIKDKNIDFAFGYTPMYILPIWESKIAKYTGLEKLFNIDPIGASLKFQIMTLPSFFGLNGIGVTAIWNPADYTTDTFSFESDFFSLNIFFVHKVRFPDTRVLLELHAGVGTLLYINPTFTYINGSQSESGIWIFPQAAGGIAIQSYFTRHWGLDITVDFSWPFFAGENLPILQVSIASGWHF